MQRDSNPDRLQAAATATAASGAQGPVAPQLRRPRSGPPRPCSAVVLLAGLIAIMSALLAALATAPSASAQSPVPACQNPRAIGLSRTIQIDTAQGPRFGTQQYQDQQPLADGEVVLTFDDGPLRRFTQPVADALDRHCTKATFFLVGRMAIADPVMVQYLHARGHTIATHTWSHQNLKSLSPQAAAGEIELGFSAVQKALGKPIAPFFRFPYLADPKAMIGHLQGRGIGIFSIDIDAYDYRAESGREVQRRILRELEVKRKGILLFHDIQPSTAEGLLGLLDELAARKFRVVHMVAKQPVATLGSYDTEAARLLERRNVAARAQPLADRSIVWPVRTPKAPEGAVVGAVPTPTQPVPLVVAPAGPPARVPEVTARDEWRRRALDGGEK